MHLEQITKFCKKDWWNCKSEEELKPSRLQLEYSEELWWPKETCCHSDSRQSPLDNVGVENLNNNKWKDLDFACELKKAAEYEGDGDTTCRWFAWNGP